jgi:hypothetical protein
MSVPSYRSTLRNIPEERISHGPIANISCFQKSAFYPGIGRFNSLTYSGTDLKDEKAQFKVALRRH